MCTDYFTHSVSKTYSKYLNHFHNGNPVQKDAYQYSTFEWGEYARKMLTENADQPKFIYLAFNAPHEHTVAPRELRERYRILYPAMPETRIT